MYAPHAQVAELVAGPICVGVRRLRILHVDRYVVVGDLPGAERCQGDARLGQRHQLVVKLAGAAHAVGWDGASEVRDKVHQAKIEALHLRQPR
jgi:hypothetical protein